MNVVEKLKTESMSLRKMRSPIAPAIAFALSEIEKIGKNNGNRPTTDDEAVKVVQKLVTTIDENLKLNIDDVRRDSLTFEKQILTGVLPQMASDEEITKTLLTTVGENRPANKGIPMKVLRDTFGAKVDMKRAGEIVSGLYGF